MTRLPFEEDPQGAYDFYYEVKSLVDKAFRMEKLGIDFINAEDLERLLTKYNPNPTEEDEDSYDRSDSTPDSAEGSVPRFELPDDEEGSERARYRSRRSVAADNRRGSEA